MILYALWEAAYTLGDVTGDGEITMADATLVFRHHRGRNLLAGSFLLAADVNGDNEITMADATLVFRHHRGRITVFPVNGH
jgi:hypothetical protein